LFAIGGSVARWPNFRPNNSKEAQQKIVHGRKKLEAVKMAKCGKKKWQKRGRKIFLQLFSSETIKLFVIS
jgi:hypothetical protein